MALAAVVFVSVFSVAAGAETEDLFAPPATEQMPKSYVRAELFATGVDFPSGFTTRSLKLNYCTGRFRGGITLYEDYESWNDNPGMSGLVALNFDYLLHGHPHRTGPFYTTGFEYGVQAAGALLGVPFVRVNGFAGAAFYGFGVGLELGAIALPELSEWPVYPYAALYVRLLSMDFPTKW